MTVTKRMRAPDSDGTPGPLANSPARPVRRWGLVGLATATLIGGAAWAVTGPSFAASAPSLSIGSSVVVVADAKDPGAVPPAPPGTSSADVKANSKATTANRPPAPPGGSQSSDSGVAKSEPEAPPQPDEAP